MGKRCKSNHTLFLIEMSMQLTPLRVWVSSMDRLEEAKHTSQSARAESRRSARERGQSETATATATTQARRSDAAPPRWWDRNSRGRSCFGSALRQRCSGTSRALFARWSARAPSRSKSGPLQQWWTPPGCCRFQRLAVPENSKSPASQNKRFAEG